MKATLVIEGKKKKMTIDLGYDDVSSIASSLPDSSEHSEIYAMLAGHPSVSVRENIAGKDKLDESTVKSLAADPEATVLRSLVRSENARKCLNTKQLLEMIRRDVDTAENIACYVESFESADADAVAETLSKHSDPRVRNSLAGNGSAPKKVLKALLKDEDARVRASAKQSLE